MGAGFSGFPAAGNCSGGGGGVYQVGTGLGDLPELCAAAVLVHLDPPEICRLARLSRVFGAAAAADSVWEAKLPENYRYLMGFAYEDASDDDEALRRRPRGKREIYALLSMPVPFDGGAKEFWIEKRTAGVCMALSAKALVITGIDDRRYWSHIATTESRFHSVAYLQQIWWFEVVGEIDFCFPAGNYSLYFRLHLGRPLKRFGRRISATDHVHGWDMRPAKFQLSTSDGQCTQTLCYLDEPGSWIHYHVGDFVVTRSDKPIKLKFLMAQIDCTHTKGGLCVDAVFVYPKDVQPDRVFTSKGNTNL